MHQLGIYYTNLIQLQSSYTIATGFANPVQISIDPNTNNIYVSNSITNGYLSKITQIGSIVTTTLIWVYGLNTPGPSVVDSNSNILCVDWREWYYI